MFKKGLLLTIIFLLVFSICGYATDYKYTQESGTGFFVSTADKSDSIEDTCELRQIINDLGALLVHSKMNGTYPADSTTGGNLQIPEAGLKFSNAPVNNDIAAYIAGEMTWQTKAELGIQPLDTALTNISALVYVSPSFIKMTAEDTYAVRTLAEVKTDLSLNYVENLKVKLDGTQAPTVNNDTDEGYVVGSRWFDITNDKEYVCLDNTDGAAVWTETTLAGSGYTNLTSFVDQTAWRLFYSNTDGDVVELALGADGTYLGSNGATSAPTFSVPSGAGDVLKVGTPVDNQVGVWTGDGTIEGTANFTYDGSNLQFTGDIGATGARITKGWFANLETTGDLTVNGVALASIYSPIAGSASIVTVGTIGTGTWEGTAIADGFIPNTITISDLQVELDAGAHSIGFTQQTVTYNVTTTTVDWKLGNKATMTFGAGNIGTFAFTNPTNPCNVLLKIVQDATGSRVVTAWDADIKWVGGTAPTLTTTANGIDICSFYWDGTNYFGVASLAFATP